MTATGVTFMGELSHMRPRQRLGWLLRQAFPGVGGAKRLASRVGISEKSARNLFADHWPGDETFAAIFRTLGEDVQRIVLAPEIDPVLAELAEREARLDRELRAIQARRRQAASLVQGRPRRGEGTAEDGPDPAQLSLFEEARP